jgi:hypothetical protein
MPAMLHLPYFFGHLGRHDVNRNDPICVTSPKVVRASTVAECRVSLLPKVLLTNVANVNDPLMKDMHLRVVSSEIFYQSILGEIRLATIAAILFCGSSRIRENSPVIFAVLKSDVTSVDNNWTATHTRTRPVVNLKTSH